MKTKQLTEYLALAGVPDGLHAQVIDCMAEARKRSAGLTWAKWRTRLFRAGKIAKAMPSESASTRPMGA